MSSDDAPTTLDPLLAGEAVAPASAVDVSVGGSGGGTVPSVWSVGAEPFNWPSEAAIDCNVDSMLFRMAFMSSGEDALGSNAVDVTDTVALVDAVALLALVMEDRSADAVQPALVALELLEAGGAPWCS